MPSRSALSLAFSALVAAGAATAQVTTYDVSTSVVTIPSVKAGSASFTNVTLRDRGNLVFDFTGGVEQLPAMPGDALTHYDLATGVLTLPAVKVGNETFLDVTLLNVGNFVFTLQTATALPASVSADVTAYFRSAEQLLATAVPASGAARIALGDSCWASNGRTRASFIADWDANSADYVSRDAFMVGRRYENIQVRALRNLSNPDGSTRREIDVTSDVVYRDGTASRQVPTTLISGSSAGTPRCATPQNSPTLRELGNQRLVSVTVRGQNWREQRYAITDGAALNPALRFRREIDFAISDPMGNGSYAILTGPGPTNTTGGVVYPFSMKLLSPRLQRSAPELQGKNGNFLNALDDDSWRNCQLPSGAVPVVELVDCVANPGNSSAWGRGFTATPNAAEDSGFLAQGWVAGGVYRFDVYNDDGWKTVRGHVGKTPVGTYYATLEQLPYSFAEMTDKYPVINLGNLTGALIAANANSAAPVPLALSWSHPGTLPGPAMHLNQIWEFHQGPKIGNPGTTLNPAYRTLTRAYPGTTALSTSSFPVSPRHADQASKTYVEYMLFYREPTTGNVIRSRINFQ